MVPLSAVAEKGLRSQRNNRRAADHIVFAAIRLSVLCDLDFCELRVLAKQILRAVLYCSEVIGCC